MLLPSPRLTPDLALLSYPNAPHPSPPDTLPLPSYYGGEPSTSTGGPANGGPPSPPFGVAFSSPYGGVTLLPLDRVVVPRRRRATTTRDQDEERPWWRESSVMRDYGSRSSDSRWRAQHQAHSSSGSDKEEVPDGKSG